MRMNQGWRCATAVSLALLVSTSYAAGDATTSTQDTKPMTGKQKATAIGATSGAVAGAVVGGPIGAAVGAGVGAVVGHQGTDARGRVSSTPSSDGTVRSAQTALNEKGYNVGSVDGHWGPNTESAVRRFQAERGLTQSGELDSATLSALGVNR